MTIKLLHIIFPLSWLTYQNCLHYRLLDTLHAQEKSTQ